ncbi:MAG: hypothetical protein Q9169_007434 [Polycauliona sp. 2 TL-2023]
MYLKLFSALLLLNLPLLIAAQCQACTSYTAARKTCQDTTDSANLTMTGTKLDTATVKCMCESNSNTAELNACQGCVYTTLADITADDYVDPLLLLSWYNVCTASDRWGEQQGAACWESQPLDYVPCVSNSIKKGGGSTVSGSSGGESASGDDGEDEAASEPTPAASSEESTSSATRCYKGIGVLVLLFVGLHIAYSA